MKNFIKIKIEPTSPADNEILIAELSDNRFYAFEETENELIAYILEDDYDEIQLKKILPAHLDFHFDIIEERNWNEEWERSIQPIFVDNFVGIRSSFHAPSLNVKYEIIITPKMSFGTGHHATTYLMIQLMEHINFFNKKVIDFGTGTGILAILAEKLGAASVFAIDNDEWSVANATENIRMNQCKKIQLNEQSTIKGISSVDIIIANINFNVLKDNAENFSSLLKKGCSLLISGILTSDETNLTGIFYDQSFFKKEAVKKEKWVAILFEKQ